MKNQALIALGTWSWGSGFAGGDQVFGNHLSQAQMQAVFDEALKQDLTLWDTAAVYGMGSSEQALAEVIKQTPREQLQLSTKFTPNIADKSSKTPVADMLEASLNRLGTDYVDYYWIHNPIDLNQWTEQFVPLLESGKIKKMGVSNHNLAQIKLINDQLAKAEHRLSAVQNHYSLLYRSSEKAGILEFCQQQQMQFFAYMVLEQGALSGRYNPQNPLPEGSGRGATYNQLLPQIETLTQAMQQMGKKYQANTAQMAVAWAIAKGAVPLVGATKPQHILDVAEASRIVLSPADCEALEQLANACQVDTKGAWEESMHS